ncbi:MAG: PDZ domain-containing protein [Pirellulaceae bacterium]|nr:PDZ domain-containing protein [Pirellulaceae bacterium]
MSVLTLMVAANLWLVGLMQETTQETAQETKPETPAIAIDGEKLSPEPSDIVIRTLRNPLVHNYAVISTGDFQIHFEPHGVPKPQFGVHVRRTDDTLRKHLKIKSGVGLVVESVVPESGAATAGVQIDDILLKLDDQWLINSEQFTTLVQNGEVGQAVKATLVREGLTQEVLVTLTEGVASVEGVPSTRLGVDLDFELATGTFSHANLPEASNCSNCHRSNVDLRSIRFRNFESIAEPAADASDEK